MVMDELELLMEIAASHAIHKWNSQISARELWCLISVLWYNSTEPFMKGIMFVISPFSYGQSQ